MGEHFFILRHLADPQGAIIFAKIESLAEEFPRAVLLPVVCTPSGSVDNKRMIPEPTLYQGQCVLGFFSPSLGLSTEGSSEVIKVCPVLCFFCRAMHVDVALR